MYYTSKSLIIKRLIAGASVFTHPTANMATLDGEHEKSVPRAQQEQPPQDERGGYECEFVEKPPEVLQTDCSVCLQILRAPHIVSCCGYSFCKTCVELVQAKNKPCPLCVQSEFTVIHDKRLQRSLNELSVWCVFQKSGCGWTDKLGALDQHLNANPDPETRLAGCGFAVLGCEHCGELIQRCLIKEHESEQCPKRPFSCDYCRDYESTFENVANNHWPVCKCYPVPCPNECTPYTVERQNLEHHMVTECPLTEVECEFSYAGCKVTLPRKEMSDHITENPLDHIRLLAVHNQKLAAKIAEKDEQMMQVITDLEVTVNELKKRNEKLEDRFELEVGAIEDLEDQHTAVVEENKALKKEIAELRKNQEESSNAKLGQKVDNLRRKVIDQETRSMTEVRERREEMAALQSHLHIAPVELIMSNFKVHKQNGDHWYSPPFYTHPQGYKMCLKVYANGWNVGMDTHVSVFAFLMRGEFDDYLKWPFQGHVTVAILNQLEDNNHATKTIRFTDTTEAKYIARVTDEERALSGWGKNKFIAHSDLDYKPAKNCQYLKYDSLRFQIELN